MNNLKTLIIILAIPLVFMSCRKADIISDSDNTDMSNYPDWTESTHSNSVTPDYDIVFPQDKVLRFDIVISADDWDNMQVDLETNLGGTGGGPGGGGPGGGGGGVTTTEYTPVWVPCSFNYDGTEWYNVGIRFKGNSSLSSAYEMGIGKLSMKLDFDQFEDDYPDLNNQRFYGFKQLNLNNNYDDMSELREKIGADVFRSFGLASAKTAFVAVYVDFGDGPQYFGLYTLVEEVDDSVLDSQFTDGSGNLYKPENTGATFANGSFNEADMNKKTNEDLADYSDVEGLYNIINSDLRTSDNEQWKTNLESVFDIEIYLKWLAANTTIQNWDTYGIMPHNYYLYNNPETNKIDWIPWDNNEAFQAGKLGGALSLYLDEVGNDWPLIRYIMDDAGYEAKYQTYLQQFTDEVFTTDKMNELYTTYSALVKDYVYAEEYNYSFLNSTSDFDMAVEELKTHCVNRNSAVQQYLNQ